MSFGPRTWLRKLRRRVCPGGEDGVTLIEVVVAAALGVIVVGASTALFTTASNSSLGSQRQAQLLAVADQQIEHIRELVKTNASGFSALAMNCDPTNSSCVPVPGGAGAATQLSYTNTVFTDPNHWLSGSCYLIEANYDNSAAGAASGVTPWSSCGSTPGAEPLVVQSGTGIVTPYQTVTVGSGTATVYEYVTETYLGCAGSAVNPSLSACGSSTNADARRVIVAVVPNNGGRLDQGTNSPQFMSTIFTNPVPSNQVNSSIGLSLGLSIG